MNPEGASSSLFFFLKQCHGVVESKYDGLYLPLTGETFFLSFPFSVKIRVPSNQCLLLLKIFVNLLFFTFLDVLLCTNLTKKILDGADLSKHP